MEDDDKSESEVERASEVVISDSPPEDFALLVAKTGAGVDRKAILVLLAHRPRNRLVELDWQPGDGHPILWHGDRLLVMDRERAVVRENSAPTGLSARIERISAGMTRTDESADGVDPPGAAIGRIMAGRMRAVQVWY